MDVWEFITNKYAAGLPVVLLYVLQSQGSSPGRQGFKMAIAGDNSICGTVGGGIMEHKFVELAKDRILQSNKISRVYNQVHDEGAGKNRSGMICSGEQTIFLYQIEETDIDSIHALIHLDKSSKNGTLTLSNTGIAFTDQVPASDFYFEECATDFILKEKTGLKHILHIVGGGHCALSLSRIMSGMDFYINVYDEREGLNTIEQNIFAHKKIIVASYNDIPPHIEGGENVYVVIMTFGYRTDDIAVRSLLNKKFKYFGILGSKKKIEKMFDVYREENISNELLTKMHAPIGLNIKSQTTEEIAISIASEIIRVKNDHL